MCPQRKVATMHIRFPLHRPHPTVDLSPDPEQQPSSLENVVVADDPRWQEVEEWLTDLGDRRAKDRFRYRRSSGGSVRHRPPKWAFRARSKA